MLRAGAIVLLSVLTLTGCERVATSGSTPPVGAATGNPRETTAPQAPDSKAGGPSGVTGSAAHPGSSGGDAVPGTTGKGTSEMGGRSQAPQPGVGLSGGLGGSTGLGMTGNFPAGTPTQGTAPQGGANRSNGSATGAR